MTRVRIRVRRQDAPDRLDSVRWEELEVEASATDTIATTLHAFRSNPVDAGGRKVAPVAFESACRFDGCGACTLLVNGRVRSACRTRTLAARPKRGPIVLEPLSKLPVVRDLVVDRRPLRSRLLAARAYLADEPRAAGPVDARVEPLDRCTECGACLEACPSTSLIGSFVGPAALGEARLLSLLPGASAEARSRLGALMAQGGVASCEKARTCVEVCPENIPLADAILALNADTARLWLRTLLRR